MAKQTMERQRMALEAGNSSTQFVSREGIERGTADKKFRVRYSDRGWYQAARQTEVCEIEERHAHKEGHVRSSRQQSACCIATEVPRRQCRLSASPSSFPPAAPVLALFSEGTVVASTSFTASLSAESAAHGRLTAGDRGEICGRGTPSFRPARGAASNEARQG